MTATTTAYRSGLPAGRDGFAQILRAEWTKFWTVRGWIIGLIVAVLVTALISILSAAGQHSGSCVGPDPAHLKCTVGHPYVPVGPGGEAVADTFYLVDHPMTGNGSITARLTSLAGATSTLGMSAGQPGNPLANTRAAVTPWAKAGLIIKQSLRQGSAYAAVMATGAHGVRMQYNYTHDSPGLPGDVSASAPRWLRLTRSGSTLTGYDSVNGTSWAKVGTARLAGLHATVQVGLFATSPVSFQRGSSGATTLATAVFDHVSGGNPAWRGHSIGASSMYPILEPGSYHRSGSTFTVSGSGDISPAVAGDIFGGDTLESILGGVLAGLIALIVVATLYITAEYRRGLIRVTLAASPRRGRVLAAKAIVIGAVTFATGLAATLIVIPISRHIQNGNGDYLFPVSPLTEMRVIIGTAAMLAVAAVAVLALGTVLRRSAGAVTAGIVLLVLPYILATALPGAGQWLMRLTPAAAFAVQQTIPAYPQVSDNYNVASGFYPLAPWAGFAVLCAWAALALALAFYLLRRRDA
jgi:ABC-type transport system involved in multi-copper enzyme maturation permease subunit